jgi:OOP family OmpA-OmpF porin
MSPLNLLRASMLFRMVVLSVVVGAALLGEAAESKVRAITSGEKSEVEGIIVSRNADTMRVEEATGTSVIVVLEENTKVQLRQGAFKLRKKSMDVTALLPGLKIQAKGTGNDQSQLAADSVTFNPDDFKIAKAMHSRVAPLEARTSQAEEDAKKAQAHAAAAHARVEELGDRVSSLDDYDTLATSTVYFAVNKTKLNADAMKDLDAIAKQAQGKAGYMIEVSGYADPTGNAERNQELSEGRAQAVVTYLVKFGKIPIRRILAPVGLGETEQEAKSAAGHKESRRVEVRLIVSKGQAG